MKKRLAIGVLLVAVVTLAVVVVKQHQRLAQAQGRLAALSAEKAKAPAPPARKATRPPPVPLAPPAEPTSAPPPMTAAASAPAAQSDAGAGTNFLAGLATMMKNPAMKEVIRTQQKMTLDKMYGSLAKYLNLAPDQGEALNGLLLDRQMAMAEAGFAVMSGSAADRQQALEETKALKDEYDQKIQDLLGPAGYQMFQQYEQTAGERMQVQMFKAALPAETALTAQQEADLIAAMAEERKAFPATALANNQTADPSQFTEEKVAELLKQAAQLQQRYADRAASILTPAQLEQFTKWQQQWSAMQTMGMKMAAQMFGNKTKAPPP